MRISRYVAVALLTAVVAVTAGCEDVPDEDEFPQNSASPSPTASTLVLASDQEAAEHLYEAWQANDRQTAGLGASAAAVDALFGTAWQPDYFWGGCTGPDLWECQYNSAQVAVIMKLEEDPVTGWKVVSVSFGNAG
jgi:hypothetical protein